LLEVDVFGTQQNQTLCYISGLQLGALGLIKL